jgi:hypothetical protein
MAFATVNPMRAALENRSHAPTSFPEKRRQFVGKWNSKGRPEAPFCNRTRGIRGKLSGSD